jgi:aminopeptidase N
MRRAPILLLLMLTVAAGLLQAQNLPAHWKPLSEEEIARFRAERHAFYAVESQGLDDAIHAQYREQSQRLDGNQADFDIRYYGLHLNLNFPAQTIIASIDYRIKSVIVSLNTVTLNLRNELTVDSVRMSGMSAGFTHSNHLLVIDLPSVVDQGQECDLTVYYHGTPYYDGAAGLKFSTQSGYQMCWTKATPFRSRYWWPCKDYPEDKADSIDMYMEVPAAYDLITNGVQVSSTALEGGRKLVHYKHNYPINTFLVAFCCMQYTINQQTWTYGGHSMPIYSYALPGNNQALDSFRIIGPQVLTTLSNLYGIYPFVNEKMANADFGWTGAMEHQTACMYATNFHTGYIIAHESAHQWWGDMITVRTFNHIWLSEGFASYSEALYYEKLYGTAAYFDYVQSQKYTGPGTIYVENLTYEEIYNGSLSYDKASWVLHMLRGVVGDSAFFKAIRDWGSSQFRYGTATTDDFVSVLNASTRQDLRWFVNEWIYGDGCPDYEISWKCTRNTVRGGFDLAYCVEQVQTSGSYFRMPVRTRFATTGAFVDTVIWEDAELNLHELWFPDSVTSVVFDPQQWVLRNVATVPFSLHIRTTELPNGVLGRPYAQTLSAIGGLPPYHWQFFGGDLPYGLEFDPATATISGTPTYPATFYFTIQVNDSDTPARVDSHGYALTVDEYLLLCGDADGSTGIDISDAVYLIAYIFSGGPAPVLAVNGDPNCDGSTDISDAVYLISYIFSGGPAPCATCP